MVSSVYAHETNVGVTYATLAKAGAKAIPASETREGEATVFGERTRSKVRPAESFMLVVVTLVGRSTRAGIAFLGAPVLCKAWVSMYIKDTRILALRHTAPVAWPEARREKNARAEVTFMLEGYQ